MKYLIILFFFMSCSDDVMETLSPIDNVSITNKTKQIHHFVDYNHKE